MGKKFNIAETFGEALRDVSNSDTGKEQIEYIDVDRLHDDPNNFYSLDGLDDLAANIELIGLQQPIRVRIQPDRDGEYIIVSGHRRTAAIRKLVADGREDLRSVACIVESDNVSPEMQELRLIYANAATREMTSADKAKQVERVTELLYKLKEQGVEFPGRMRDHVAEAVKVSKSQIARWEVIKKGLIAEFMPKWESGKINESQAYALARFAPEFQRRLAKATPKIEKYSGSNMESVLRHVEDGHTYETQQTCPDGNPCSHSNGFLLHDLGSSWHDCKGIKCCMTCSYGASANSWGSPCDRMCTKAQNKRRERAAKEREKEERERNKQISKEHAIEQAACARIIRAADTARIDMDTKIPVGRYSSDKQSLAIIRKRAGGDFSEYRGEYYDTVQVDNRKGILDQAKILKCSTDYILGSTDDLQSAEELKAPCQAQGSHWVSVEERLPAPGKYVLTSDPLGLMEVDCVSPSDGTWERCFGVRYWMPLPTPPEE